MSKANMTYREADSVDCAASPSCSEQGCHTACGSVHARQGSLGSSRSQGRRGRVFWWSVSGTLLSVVGFIGLALFEQSFRVAFGEACRSLAVIASGRAP